MACGPVWTRRAPLTDAEIKQAFEFVLGVTPRAADLAVLRVLNPAVTTADLAEYIWDHWLGEPDNPTLGK